VYVGVHKLWRVLGKKLGAARQGYPVAGFFGIDRPWDSYTDDHLGLMDHQGIGKFMVLGFCIGGPFIWNLLQRTPDRVVAAVAAQPVGFRPEKPTVLYDSGTSGWARPEITMEMADKFLTKMYRTSNFVFTVTRDFVRNCQTPVLIRRHGMRHARA